MRIVALVVAGLLLAGTVHADSIVDSADRKVELPAKTTRILAAGPPAAVLLYTLVPDKLLGWPRSPDAEAQAYLAPRYRNLPTQLRLTGRNPADPSAIKDLGASLIVDYGTVNANYAAIAERMQAATGIPYVLIDGSLDLVPAAYRTLGKAAQAEPRATLLADRSRAMIDAVGGKLGSISADAAKRLYVARGPDGTDTYGSGAFTREIIGRAGGVNVAERWGAGALGGITPDKVREADPDVVIALDPYFLEVIAKSDAWKQVPAIAASRVYLAPRHPFGWLDEPPSVNRLIGLAWLARVLHPDRFDGDFRAAVRDFYRVFYQVDLDGPQIDRLLGTR
jgi:iron complex transport system substrate-binding protein